MSDTGGTSIDELLAEATARTVSVRVLLRQELLEQHTALETELQAALNADASENRDAVGPTLARRLVEFEAEIEAAKREFTFKAVGRKKWADLLAEHPATKEQKRVRDRLDHNPETFPVAAIAASCVSPKLTLDSARKLEDAINSSVFDELWQACLDANVGGSGSPKSLLAGSIMRANADLEKSRSSSGLPEASSSDG